MRIGEVADQVGVDPPTIRFYESAGVLPEPERTASGYRSYEPTDVDRLRFVVRSRSLDLSLEDIREIIALRDGGVAPCGYVGSLLERQAEIVAERIADLEALAAELEVLRRRARTIPDEVTADGYICPILQHREHLGEKDVPDERQHRGMGDQQNDDSDLNA